MSAFTIFFCGTGSNSYDFAHLNYIEGELISTLARNHTGMEFIDWIIVDGPGSGDYQEAEKWVPSGRYATWRGQLQGKGWEQNVQHAIAVLHAQTSEGRKEHTKEEIARLRSMGVGIQDDDYEISADLFDVDRRLKSKPSDSDFPLRPRISPQELQKKKVEIFAKTQIISCINLVGWSRGGVTCIMCANALAETRFSNVPVNIFACDPVPGLGQFDNNRVALKNNVRNYVGIYARDERSRGFTPIVPTLAPATNCYITTIPGRHATLVGNRHTSGGSEGMNTLQGPGKVTRDLAEKKLESWGTSLKSKLSLDDSAILKLYDEMLSQTAAYKEMHSKSYTGMSQKWSRAVVRGSSILSTSFSSVDALKEDPHFVNAHHRSTFRKKYPVYYSVIFDGAHMTPEQYWSMIVFLINTYPSHAKYWSKLLSENR